jgi:hypothetical protein
MTLALICGFAALLGGVVGWMAGPKGYRVVMPDDFPRDPYGYLTNQAGHMLLGFCMAFTAALVGVAIADEPPARLDLLLILLCAFGAFEVCLFGAPFDLFEDVTFTVIYGSGGTIYGVKWVEGFAFKADLLAVAPFLGFAAVHLTLGALWRLWDGAGGRG